MWNRSHPHDRRDRLFGGSGTVSVWDLCNGSPLAPVGAIVACELDGGGSVGVHVQQEFAEVVIVIEGQGGAQVAGAAVSLGPGAVVQIPLGHTLALENGSAHQPLRYLIVKAR